MPSSDPVLALAHLIDSVKCSVAGNVNVDRQVVAIASDADSAGTPTVARVTSAGNLGVDATAGIVTVQGTPLGFPQPVWLGGNSEVRMTAAAGATAFVITNQAGRLYQIRNVGAAQTATVTLYDNATLASGNVIYTLSQLGPGQIIAIYARYNNGCTARADVAIGSDIVFSIGGQ